MVGGGEDLAGRQLTVAAELQDQNPRRAFTHGWVAFEVLRRADGGSLTFEEYHRRLFAPERQIQDLADQVKGQRNAYQDLKHIRCDIFRGAVRVDPPLPRSWFDVQRCSPGTRPATERMQELHSPPESRSESSRGRSLAPPLQEREPTPSPSHDAPKSLRDPVVRMRRNRMLEDDHIRPLTEFVHRIREAEGLQEEVPYFDPLDGGVRARCLSILEAPGRKAVDSGFISRNNPDETARNSFLLYQEAGLERKDTLLWNIVPWYIGTGTRIRPATTDDVEDGFRYLRELLGLLPRLRAVFLVGRNAQKAERRLARMRPDLSIFKSPHPSPLFVNNKPGNRDVILGALRKVAQFLET